MVYQTSGQIEDLYGQDGAKEILQGLQNKFVFRCSDPDTSKKASLELGEQELEEISTSIQFGQLNSSDRNSLNRSIKTRPVVMPSQIQNLPDLQAYIKLCHLNPTLIHFEYRSIPQINLPNNSEIPEHYLLNSTQQPEANYEANEKPLLTFDPDKLEEKKYNFDADESEPESDSDSNFLKFD